MLTVVYYSISMLMQYKLYSFKPADFVASRAYPSPNPNVTLPTL